MQTYICIRRCILVAQPIRKFVYTHVHTYIHTRAYTYMIVAIEHSHAYMHKRQARLRQHSSAKKKEYSSPTFRPNRSSFRRRGCHFLPYYVCSVISGGGSCAYGILPACKLPRRAAGEMPYASLDLMH